MMDRRAMMGLVGAGAAGFLAMGETVRADHKRGEHDEHIETLGKCAKLCAEAAGHCLDVLCKGGSDNEKHARALEMAAGCEKFCSLTASLMACGNPLQKHMHLACANACRDCAEACQQAGNSGLMAACARACRECEEMCRRLG